MTILLQLQRFSKTLLRDSVSIVEKEASQHVRSGTVLQQKIKVCMFDQYGTVVDMQSGLTEAVAPYLQRKGWTGDPSRLVTWWRRAHFENSMIDALLHRRPHALSGHWRTVALLHPRTRQHLPTQTTRSNPWCPASRH